MRVAVTGAAGLLGRHALRAVAEAGHEPWGIDRPDQAQEGILGVDLTDVVAARGALGGVDAVLHAAALPRPVGFDADEVFRTNMGLTYAVLAAAEAHGVRRVVYASSFSVLGPPFAPRPVAYRAFPIEEAHPAQPQDVYALTKWLGEEMVDAWSRRTDGVAVSLRIPWIQTPQSFEAEVVPRRRTPEAALDLWAYIDARDAARALVRALEARVAGHQRLFVSAADSYAERPTAELVAEAYPGVPLARPLGGRESLIDAARARRMIGFEPRHGWCDYAAEAAHP